MNSGSPSRPTKQEWFDRGAEYLRSFAEGSGSTLLIELTADADCYLCPLCLRPTTSSDLGEDGTLTIEHAPPASQGGWGVTLTCKRCNHDLGGSQIDNHVANSSRLSEFLAGETPAIPERIALTVGDATIRGDLYLGPGFIGFAGPSNQRANRPSDLERMDENIHAAFSGDQASLSAHIELQRRCDPDMVELSWIRSAYLAAFAEFGWKWALNPALQPIRDQLQDPTSPILPQIYLNLPELPGENRLILVIDEPSRLRGAIVAQWGPNLVFLPGVGSLRSIEQLSEALDLPTKRAQVKFSLSGGQCEWPREPIHLADQSDWNDSTAS